MTLDPSYLQALSFRCIGPPRGGRVLAAVGHPSEVATFYFGGCAGGVWKTTDAGTYWENISDGFFGSAAVGAIAIAESDPNVIYVGTGESTIRLDVSWGDGVYKSTDGGKSWTNVGLAETKHISKIRIHPHNPDIVYVAALGHAFGNNPERGIFRTTDGGKTWQQVLFKSERAGAADLALDVTNPRILYASFYQVYRNFWELNSGGPDSGLWKSSDGGETWVDISANKGLPNGTIGKIGVTVSPANPNRVWAIIEAEGDKAGVYRSDNGGKSWEQVSSNRELIQRPWYYCHIFADPQDADTVYINNLKMWKSTDGGKNYSEITTPHGDNHDLWIDPNNPKRMINGNDGGACVTLNGGASWSTIYNQLTAQFYRIDIDNRFPYYVYGTQQDNSSIAVPSATEQGAIPWGDCYPAGTGESGFIAVKPDDANIVYVGAVGSSPGGGGALQRYDHRTKQIRLVTVWPESYFGEGVGAFAYRFPWTFPISFSPHDSNVLYSTGNHLFRTLDEGSSWQVISPDLTRNDPEKLRASGGLTLDTSGAEHYCTLSSFVESPHKAGLFWAGSDDGLLHISQDGGATWQNITPSDLPAWSYVHCIELSAHAAGTAYVAVTRYKLDEYRPWLYKTSDYGASWQRIDASFPQDEVSRVIREDATVAGLLFVGTETGIFVSFNDGASWQRLHSNLPVVPVYDLKIKGNDLVIGTHGRSFWVLDDITPLRAFAAKGASASPLIAPATTIRYTLGWGTQQARGKDKNYMMGLGANFTFTEEKGENGEAIRRVLDGGENPPAGVIIYYTLPNPTSSSPYPPISLEFLDAAGKTIKTFKPKAAEPDKKAADERTLPTKPGLNRFVWDMRYPDAERLIGDPFVEKATTGAIAAPGHYAVKLTLGEQSWTENFEIVADPRVTATQEDLQAQFALWQGIVDKVTAIHGAVIRIRRIREQVNEWQKRAGDNSAISDAAKSLNDKLATVEKALVQVDAKTASDRLLLPSKLNTKLLGLIAVVSCADFRPPQQAYNVFDHLSAQADQQLSLLDGVLGDDLAAFNDLVKSTAIAAVV